MTILEDSIKEPFLSLIVESVNNSHIAICPEFEVSAGGYDREDVVKDVYNLIKHMSSNILADYKQGKDVPIYLRRYSEKVIETINNKKDISTLFRK